MIHFPELILGPFFTLYMIVGWGLGIWIGNWIGDWIGHGIGHGFPSRPHRLAAIGDPGPTLAFTLPYPSPALTLS